jgi:hypothetical protein
MNMVEFRKIQIVDIPNDIKNKKLIFVEFFTAEKKIQFFLISTLILLFFTKLIKIFFKRILFRLKIWNNFI